MNPTTRLIVSISNFIIFIQNIFFYKEKNFSTKLLLLFLGFVIGSLFGTFLPNFPGKINSHSFSIILVISIIEIINCLVYSSKQRNIILGLDIEDLTKCLLLIKVKFLLLFYSEKQEERITNNLEMKTRLVVEKKGYFYRNMNSFKLGIMLGFFIDAFKVGS